VNRARQELKRLLAAVQYFTRLPVPAWVGHDQALLDDSVRYFPAVGLLVGAIGAAVLVAAAAVWPMTVAIVLSMMATLVVTGAFHEDGLADAVDGLGGSLDRGRVLEIMKDSRIGAFGAIALVLVLLLKFATLSTLPVRLAAPVLVLGHAVSRLGSVFIMATLPYVRDTIDSRAKPLIRSVSMTSIVTASITGLLPLAVLPLVGVGGGAAVAAVAVICRGYFKRRLGGYTGDCLGAVQQLGEGVFYLVCAAAL
jgi:adenosylcobinamide-GDP ribazoletransferase